MYAIKNHNQLKTTQQISNTPKHVKKPTVLTYLQWWVKDCFSRVFIKKLKLLLKKIKLYKIRIIQINWFRPLND